MTAAAEPFPHTPWWGRISLLWLMSVPVAVTAYSLGVGIPPHDFWWHARAGGIIATTGSIPKTNIFCAALPADAPYFYQSWISELLFYRALEWGGSSLHGDGIAGVDVRIHTPTSQW